MIVAAANNPITLGTQFFVDFDWSPCAQQIRTITKNIVRLDTMY